MKERRIIKNIKDKIQIYFSLYLQWESRKIFIPLNMLQKSPRKKNQAFASFWSGRYEKKWCFEFVVNREKESNGPLWMATWSIGSKNHLPPRGTLWAVRDVEINVAEMLPIVQWGRQQKLDRPSSVRMCTAITDESILWLHIWCNAEVIQAVQRIFCIQSFDVFLGSLFKLIKEYDKCPDSRSTCVGKYIYVLFLMFHFLHTFHTHNNH